MEIVSVSAVVVWPRLSSDAARLAKEIAGHDADIAAWTGDVKAATEVSIAKLKESFRRKLHKWNAQGM
eukprot:5523391-Amphidinium_carterae.1